jgi:hypothetical protein
VTSALHRVRASYILDTLQARFLPQTIIDEGEVRNAADKKVAKGSQTRAFLSVRMQSLRCRNSLRKQKVRLRTSTLQNYAETTLDDSARRDGTAFRLCSFSTHSTNSA